MGDTRSNRHSMAYRSKRKSWAPIPTNRSNREEGAVMVNHRVALRMISALCPLSMDFFQKPRQVLSEDLHGPKTFRILFDLARIASHADIPVT